MSNFRINRDYFTTGDSEQHVEKKHRDTATLLGVENYKRLFHQFALAYGGDNQTVSQLNGKRIADMSDEEYEENREKIAENLKKVKAWADDHEATLQLDPDNMRSYSNIDPRKAEQFADTFGHSAFMEAIGLGDLPLLTKENLANLNPNITNYGKRKHDSKSTG